jgi:glycosyltransferase involved in cell wall biosynthesis
LTELATNNAADSGNPLVSILTPSFNQAAWLPANLRSVACQTYPNIEHIVMDGGSTDGSVAILEAAGPEVHWRSEPDSGQSDAINKAFRASHGEIIGWVNSDDAYFDCRVIEDVVAFFDAHPDVDVAYGHAAQVDADGTIIWMIWVPWFIRRVLRIANFIGQPVAFIRRRALSDPMLDESYHFTMDYELWLRLDRAGCRFKRMPRITAVDRHQPQRKGETISHVLRADLSRLEESGQRRYPPGKAILSWLFYTWRRFMGIFLIFRIPRDLAFTDVHTSRWDIFVRQALSWNRAWPADYVPKR